MSESDTEKDNIRMSTRQVLNTYFVQVSVVLAGVFIGVYWGSNANLVIYYTIVAAVAIVLGIVLNDRSARNIADAFNKLSIKMQLLSDEVEKLNKMVKEMKGDRTESG